MRVNNVIVYCSYFHASWACQLTSSLVPASLLLQFFCDGYTVLTDPFTLYTLFRGRVAFLVQHFLGRSHILRPMALTYGLISFSGPTFDLAINMIIRLLCIRKVLINKLFINTLRRKRVISQTRHYTATLKIHNAANNLLYKTHPIPCMQEL